MIIKIALTVILSIGFSTYAQEASLFDKGNQFYNEAKFAEAVAGYNEVLKSGQESTALYYNLGNAHYKLNQIGASIYNYEKALLLNPNDSDVKNNLKFAQNATIDQIEVLPQGFIKKSINSIAGSFSFNGWAWISVLGVFAFVILFITYYKAGTTNQKRFFFVSSWVCLLVALLSVVFAFRQYDFVTNKQYAIIFATETTIKGEPNLRSDIAFTLHEGTKVAVLQELNDWRKIKLVDGKIGWIPASDLKEL